MAKYLVPASLLLSQSMAAATLFDSYVSLSFELIGFPTFAGKHNTAFRNIQGAWIWTNSCAKERRANQTPFRTT
jgi:hypothetical protein